jgi:predicted dehydrogenase
MNNIGPVLVIGCGSIGKRHVENLIGLGMTNVLAFDVSKDRLARIQAKYGADIVDTLEEAWKCKPSVAFITTPTNLHIPMALEAARHGCHLFIEKPLSDSLDGVRELMEVVTAANLVTLIGCNMRFHPGLRKVKELVEAKSIGTITSARVETGKYLPDWRPSEDYRKSYSASAELGGGIILDAIHELDYIRWILGEVDSVVCFSGKVSHLEIHAEETAAILLRFGNGAIGEVHLDYIQRTPSRTCQIIGDEGTIRWDNLAGTVRLYQARTSQWVEFEDPTGWTANQMYVDEVRHFLQCLTRSEPSAQDIHQAARILRIALAAKQSEKSLRVETIND